MDDQLDLQFERQRPKVRREKVGIGERIMKSRWLLVIMLAVTGCSPQSDSSPESALACSISTLPSVQLGQVPKVRVEITNLATSAIQLPGSLDASDCRWRFPHCYFEVVGPDEKSSLFEIPRCAMVSPLRAKDFIRLEGGKSLNPYGVIDAQGFFQASQLNHETFKRPGRYRIRFTYSTASHDLGEYAYDPAAPDRDEIIRRFAMVPHLKIQSNEILVDVIEPAPNRAIPLKP